MKIPFALMTLALSNDVNMNVKAKQSNKISRGSRGIKVDSKLGSSLLSHARQLDNRNVDYSFIGGYSIKFQGCHHINQWNEYAADEDDVRIMTKRLVRFRLCPADDCNDEKTGGCNSKYGDYVVDMNMFVDAYLQSEAFNLEAKCEATQEICDNTCNGGDDDCIDSCYSSYGLSGCVEANGDDAVEMIDPMDYAYCAQMDFPAQDDDNNKYYDDAVDVEFYVGPYCADQGGEINLGLFTDDTCTTFSAGGKSLFYQYAGYELPYGNANMVNEQCMSCMLSNADDDVNQWVDGMDVQYVNEFCASSYLDAGKCETKMNVDYPNEAACTYIEGIKIIRDDGVIRTTSVKKSKAAAVSIGLFTTCGVLLSAYIYYLRTKLSRAKISLSSQG